MWPLNGAEIMASKMGNEYLDLDAYAQKFGEVLH
jgi:hypothetical protein